VSESTFADSSPQNVHRTYAFFISARKRIYPRDWTDCEVSVVDRVSVKLLFERRETVNQRFFSHKFSKTGMHMFNVHNMMPWFGEQSVRLFNPKITAYLDQLRQRADKCVVVVCALTVHGKVYDSGPSAKPRVVIVKVVHEASNEHVGVLRCRNARKVGNIRTNTFVGVRREPHWECDSRNALAMFNLSPGWDGANLFGISVSGEYVAIILIKGLLSPRAPSPPAHATASSMKQQFLRRSCIIDASLTGFVMRTQYKSRSSRTL
jgi:hypothetical protein